MFNEKYKGLGIVISYSAMQELMQEGKTIYDVVKFWKMVMMLQEKEDLTQ